MQEQCPNFEIKSYEKREFEIGNQQRQGIDKA